MRRFALLCSAAVLYPAFAMAQVCSVDGGAASVAVAPPGQVAPAPAGAARLTAAPGDRNVYPVIGAEEINRSPALRRIASRGATLLDLGTDDGLRTVFAHNGDDMEVFYVAPGGRYAVRGGRMLDFGATDPSKRDLTLARASIIPGAVPSVDMRTQAAAPAAAPSQAAAVDGNAVLAQLDKADFGVVGRADAPRLYMFVDPLCSFSVRAIEALRPHIAAGRLQVALVPVAIIDHETSNRSTPAAATMLGKPGEMDTTWRGIVDAARMRRPDAFDPTAEGVARLDRNKALAASLQVQATPTLVWRQSDGAPRAQMGGQDLDAVLASLAGARR